MLRFIFNRFCARFNLISAIVFFIFIFSNTSAEDRLIFYHIPKCGGTTARSLLDQKFHLDQIYKLNSYKELIQDYEILDQKQFFRGHLYFYFGNLVLPQGKNITFLREPISRVLSDYRYWQEKEQNLETQKVLEDFFTLFQNLQVKMLSQLPPDSPKISIENHLESAKMNLKENFFFVGITERLTDSFKNLYLLLGWEPLKSIPIMNITKKKENYSEELIEKIKSLNWADIELYEYAKVIFEEKLKNMENLTHIAQPLEFVHRIHYTFDQPLDGEGWGYRETNLEYHLITRTTNEQEAFIYFPIHVYNDYILEFTASYNKMDQLEVLVNDKKIKLECLASGIFFKLRACIPKEYLKENYKTKISFKVPFLFIPSDHSHKNDHRKLGLQVSEIEIYPTDYQAP